MSRVTRCVEPGKYHEVYFAIAFPELGDRHHYSLQRLTGSTTVETFFEGCDLKRTQWNSIRSRKARLDHGGPPRSATGTREGRRFHATPLFLTSLDSTPEALLMLVRFRWGIRAGIPGILDT